ncbi:stereocilin [Apteryx mantelli]|uniref:Stereocilin n=1 Tax=Apteryx mantelli TaxID=2696672 RepID=A0ABM4F9B1_9AVES
MPALMQTLLAGLEALGVPPVAGARPAQTPRGARQGKDGLSSFLHNISRLLEHPEQAGEPWGPVLQPQPQPQQPPGDPLPRATLLHLQHVLLSLRGSWHWDALLGLLHRLRSLSGAEQPLVPQPRWRLLGSLAEALGQALVAGALGPGGAGLQSPRRTPVGHGGCSGGPGWLAWLLAPPQPWSPRDRRPAGAQALRPEPPWAPVGEARAEEPGWAMGPCGAAQRALEALRQRLARATGCGLYSHFRRRVSHVRGALVHEASLALRVPHLDGDGRCSAGTLQQLLLWGFHHNISWDARALGFAAAALPAPPPLTGCLQPVPRKAAAPRGEPSLLPPVLEAVCNDSIPGLPGISNFTVYLYCNLFNSSRGSSQRPGDLGAACSDADWYLSGGSAWAWACQEHFPAEFNATVCSNVSLRETPGPQQLLLEELCASLATSPSTFQEPTRANASLAQPLGHPQPGVPARCQDGWSGAHHLLRRLLALLPLPPGPGPAAYLLGLTSRLARCQEEPPGWVPHTNYLLRLLDLVLALSELDAAGQAAREPLSEAILLSSLMDNTSFWDSLRANASGGILQAVGRYLGQERRAAAKRELLGCFSAVLWDLLQEDEETPMLEILLQEYLQMPRENLHQLLLSAESEAMQRFLALLHRSWLTAALQVLSSREEALQSLASLLLRRFPHLTPQLFVDLSQFIPFMAVSDIMRFPPALLANETVLAALRMHSTQLTPGQKAAFARRLLQAPFLGAVPTWPLGFLHAALPLLPHLPLSSFLQLTPQQVWGLGDGWQPLRLGLVQGRHVAHSLVNRSREAGPKAAQRLGALACFLSSEELQELASLQDPRGPVEQSLLACAAAGTLPQHGRVMLALADLLRSTNLATVGPGELPVWKGVLPEMGVGFLERLSAAQLDALLPTLQPAQLTRTQAMAGDADRLCPLLPGLGPTSLAAVLALLQRQGCACLGPALPLLSAAQTAALLQALQVPAAKQGWRPPATPQCSPQCPTPPQGPRQEQPLDGWPDCLLPLVPLQLLRPGAQALRGTPRALQLPWSPQQAQLLWREVGAGTNRSHCATGALGSLAVGMSCTALQELRREDFLGALGTLYARPRSLPASLVRRRLRRAQPGPARPGGSRQRCPQRRCVQEEVLRRPPLAREELARLGPEFLMELPAKLLETLPAAALRPALDRASRRPRSLLALPPARRAALARRALRALGGGAADGEAAPAARPPPPAAAPLAAEALDALGALVGFLGRESAARLAPESLLPRLQELQDTCVAAEAAEELGRRRRAGRTGRTGPGPAVPHAALRRPPPRWRPPALQQLGRLVFLLPARSLRAVPRDLLSRATVEQLLQSQRDWDRSELGRLCRPPGPGPGPQQALVAPLVGADEPGHRAPVPSCADVRATFPAAWSAAQLAAMDPAQLQRCLGLLSQDPALRPDQLRAVLGQARRVRRDGDGAAARDTGAGLGCAGLGSCAWPWGRAGHGGCPWGCAGAGTPGSVPTPCAVCPGAVPAERWPAGSSASAAGAVQLLGSVQAPEPALALLLGRLATQLGESELRQLVLSDWWALSALGDLDGWSAGQTQAVVSSFLRQRGVRARDLVLPELVALGHLLCGLRAAEMQSLDAKELSKAAPFLGSLSLRCSEQQMEALAARLTSSAAFGPASAWGPEIFTEIGTLAAGLPDIVLSALVPEQIWALTPQAIAAIPAPKFAVVFGSAQLLTLSSAQASAVTPEQRRRLSSAQRRALASAQYEGEAAQDGQGRSGASPRSGFTLALLFCLPRSCLCAPW